MRCLLIEDEEKLLQSLIHNLNSEGFIVDTANNGKDGLTQALSNDYDLIILDILLPGMTGTEILQRIRARDPHIPLLMLTAQDSLEDKVRHFQAGADDYLTKPFSFVELLIRIKALLRRRGGQSADVLRVSDLEINRVTRKVKRGEQVIELSAKEYALLEFLALNPRRVLSRHTIVEHVWDQSFEGLTNIVDVYIRHLRAKIDDGFDEKLIRTLRGAGYMFANGSPP